MTDDHDLLKTRISHFVQHASLEITPQEKDKTEDFGAVLKAGRRVFITHLPGSDPKGLIECAVKLRNEGMEPVPHLAARSLKGAAQLEEILARLHTEAAVADVLIIGGAVDRPKGEFDSTMDMLETGLFEKYGIKYIGIAGHPEGSPDIPDAEIIRALSWKHDYMARTGTHLYLVTQFLFDADRAASWDKWLQSEGFHFDVHIGIAGPTKLSSLIKYAKNCGVGNSLRFLQKQGSSLTKLAMTFHQDEFITQLVRYTMEAPETLLKGAHFYSFGGIEKTEHFIETLEREAFTMKNDKGFDV